MIRLPPRSTPFPYTTLFRSGRAGRSRSQTAQEPPGCVLVKLHSLVEVRIRRNNRPADDVRVAAHVLGGRVDHYVRPQSQRVLEVRRGEGVVDSDYRAAPVRHLRELLNIGEGQQGVGGGLDPEKLGLGPRSEE